MRVLPPWVRKGYPVRRLVGVDPPETVDHRLPVEFFGKAASAFTRRLAVGQTARVECRLSLELRPLLEPSRGPLSDSDLPRHPAADSVVVPAAGVRSHPRCVFRLFHLSVGGVGVLNWFDELQRLVPTP